LIQSAWVIAEQAKAAKAKAKAENIAYMEEGRRARERLAAGAIAELEAKRAGLPKREDFFPLQHN
jgi:hypothetical protein